MNISTYELPQGQFDESKYLLDYFVDENHGETIVLSRLTYLQDNHQRLILGAVAIDKQPDAQETLFV